MIGLAHRANSIVPQAMGNTKIEPQPCKQCDQVFWSEDALRAHAMTHPSPDKAFTCEICNKSFRFRSNLAEHRSVHTALKPFVCKFCGKSSRLKGNLTKHILKHHRNEHEASFNSSNGKDDSILTQTPTRRIFGGKKTNKDPAAVDFLEVRSKEKSMMVIGEHDRRPTTATPKSSVSITTSHLDGNALSRSNCTSASPESWFNGQPDYAAENEAQQSAQALSTALLGLLGQQHAAQLLHINNANLNNALSSQMEVDQKSTPMDSTVDSPAEQTHSEGSQSPTNGASQLAGADGTKCTLCQKHFRKAGSLALHMTIRHGHPPPASADPPSSSPSVEQKSPSPVNKTTSTTQGPPPLKHAPMSQLSPKPSCTVTKSNGVKEVKNNESGVKVELTQLKQQLRTMQQDHQMGQKSTTSLEAMDARVARLEKQVETVLTTMYTLVQLQTGMNQTLQNFKEDANKQLQHINQMVTGELDVENNNESSKE